jgi:WS/DGAT/MGAT family acyltransferase
MSYSHFERLSPMDLSFLAVEDGRAHMHIGSVSLYDAQPLRCENGGVDYERILEFIEAQLYKVPRTRQKLAWVPGFGQPVWVDDAHFNPRFHVRHAALPPPGDLRQLKRMSGRILSQEFDREKPLWEHWIVDGVEGNRFAVISKVHHCVADGVAGVEMANLLVGPDPDYKPEPPKAWTPRPAPTDAQLVLEELQHRVRAPFELLRALRRDSGDAQRAPASRTGLAGMIEGIREALPRKTQTPLDLDEVGPHRRFDWTRMPFARMRAIGASAGGTLNDVALAIASGALQRFMRRRGVTTSELEFRAIVPMSVRKDSERAALGNRISGMLTELPLDEPDPWKRLLRVIETTHELKASTRSSGSTEVLERVADLLPTQLLIPILRAATRSIPANIVITNVPGPRVPVYLLGARLLETYPVVPVTATQSLGIALLSYDDTLSWGFNADWDAVPDLHDLVEDVEAEFEALSALLPSEDEANQAARVAGA